MNDNHVEYPHPSEKLSYKFILDGLKDQSFPEAPPQEEDSGEAAPSNNEVESESCGKEAPPATVDEQFPSPSLPLQELLLPEGKNYFRIGEVSGLIGVESYVLRYWESEFAIIKPHKSGSGQRVYSRRDVETLNTIRHLLHVEKFSIKGAKKKLFEKRKEDKDQLQKSEPTRKFLKELATDLKELIALAK